MKRQKEMARQQRQRDKAARRLEKKTEIPGGATAPEGEDPAIAGIRPGPQPLPDEWHYQPPRARVPRDEGGDPESKT